MSLDLNKLETKLDEALSNETSETLNKFLNNKSMTNNKQHTAVEWQFEQLFNSFEKFNNSEYTFDEYLKRNLEIREQAKEMEKQEHGKTWDAALSKYEVRAGNYMRAYEDFDDYYDETFKKD